MLARTCYKTVLSRLAMFPAVLLLGPRQVGKTTLAEAIAADGDNVYLDLENPRDRGKLVDPASSTSEATMIASRPCSLVSLVFMGLSASGRCPWARATGPAAPWARSW